MTGSRLAADSCESGGAVSNPLPQGRDHADSQDLTTARRAKSEDEIVQELIVRLVAMFQRGLAAARENGGRKIPRQQVR